MAMVHGGEIIKVARTTRGMTQDELSLLSGFGRRTLQRWESKKAEPTYSAVVMICNQICGISIEKAQNLVGA